MEGFKERLIEEEFSLNEKIIKLDIFIKSDSFNKIDSFQQALLSIQLQSMKTYQSCLNHRLHSLN